VRFSVLRGLVPALLLLACATPTAPASPPATPGPPTTARPVQSAPVPTAAHAPAVEPTTVKVGVLGVLAEAGHYLALERGYFAEEGLQIEYVPFDTGARMVSALGADQLDVGAGGVSAGLFNAVARGVGIRVVAPQSSYAAGRSPGYLVVRRELVESGQVRDYPDLRGRTLGLNARASVNDYIASLAAERGGFPLAELNMVEMGFGEQVTALANAAIDVAILAEPLATVVAERGTGVKWRELADLEPGLQVTVLLYSPGFSTERAAVARRWMIAYLRGVRDYMDALIHGKDRDRMIDALVKHTPNKDPALYDRIGMALIDPNGEVNRASLERQLRWISTLGVLQGTVTLDDVVDPSFAARAVERLGRH
jgi:NitT/TauT family transport system substrate-binding protein